MGLKIKIKSRGKKKIKNFLTRREKRGIIKENKMENCAVMDIKNILSKCDHTLLLQTSTWEEIKKICDDGIKYATASVCIPPCYVKQAKEYVGEKLKICTVIGFPNGYNATAVKVFETKQAIEDGADEIDMVINIGWLKAKCDGQVCDEIKQIKVLSPIPIPPSLLLSAWISAVKSALILRQP